VRKEPFHTVPYRTLPCAFCLKGTAALAIVFCRQRTGRHGMSVQQKWIFGGLLGGLLLLLFPPFLYSPAGAGRQWGFLLGFPAYVVYHHALLRAVYAGRRCRGAAHPGTMRAGRPAGCAGRTEKGRYRFSAAGNGQRRRFLIYRVLLHADCGVSPRAENSRRNNTRRARRPSDEGWTRAPRAENRRNNFARVHTRATLEVRI